SQTSVMVRADIVRSRKPFYDVNCYFADSYAIYEILEHCDFGFVHQVLTFSRVESGSTPGRMQSYNPSLLARFKRLRAFCPMYLTPDEYERLFGEHEQVYRRFLAEAWLRRREPEFWTFHEKGLAVIGATIDRSRFIRDAASVVLHYAFSPQTLG